MVQQSDVLECLKKARKWMSAKDIYAELKCDGNVVGRLSRLIHYGMVERKRLPSNNFLYRFRGDNIDLEYNA